MKVDLFKQFAISQAMRSTYKKRMGAVVVRKGKLVGSGCNKVNSTGRLDDGIHAEIDALNNTTARYRQDSTVYVCRLTKLDVLAMAMPCEACQAVMRKMGVKYAWYTTEDGWYKLVL